MRRRFTCKSLLEYNQLGVCKGSTAWWHSRLQGGRLIEEEQARDLIRRQFDLFKHISTLDTAVLLLLAAFYEGLSMSWVSLLFTVGGAVVSLGACLIGLLLLATSIDDDPKLLADSLRRGLMQKLPSWAVFPLGCWLGVLLLELIRLLSGAF